MMTVKLANRLMTKAIGFTLVFAALSPLALAISPAAPEIDPGSVASAMTLLISGAFVVSRKARKS